jgi:Ca2+-binding EF-hand superfamily protein
VASAVPEGKVASHRLIKTFECEQSNVVDVLEILSGLICAGCASIPDKITKLFSLFDFDSSEKITYDEMFIMLFTTLRAMVRLQGKGMEPEDSDVEKMVDEIFLKNDKEPTVQITLKEFETWVMEELNMGIKKGQKKHVQMSAVMVKFDVLDEEDAKEIEEKRLLASAQQNKGKKGHHHRKSHAPGRNSPTPDSGRVSPSGHK